MIARFFVTAGLLLIAAGNFLSGVLLPPGPFNPFGILFLAMAGAFWFGWEIVKDAYADQEERRRAGRKIPNPLFVRFAPGLGALSHRPLSHRPPSHRPTVTSPSARAIMHAGREEA
jgi:hypothetical protein